MIKLYEKIKNKITYANETVLSLMQKRKYKLVRDISFYTLCGTLLINSLPHHILEIDKGDSKSDSFSTTVIYKNYNSPKIVDLPTTPEIEETLPLSNPKKVSNIQSSIVSARAKKMNEEKERIIHIEETLKEYAKYLAMDEAKVLSLAYELTEDFTIPFRSFTGNIVVEDEDAAMLIFAYRLSRGKLNDKLEMSAYSLDDILLDVETVQRAEGEPLALESGESGSEFMGRICDILGIDKAYTLSISLLESGKMNSPLCRLKNNFGGLRGQGGFASFSTPEAGIIAHCINIKSYERFGLLSISALSGLYVNGDVASPSETWINNVLGFHYQISADMESYFHMEENVEEETDEVKEKSIDITEEKVLRFR